ncbi:MAG TPA: S41 family peptidase [Planktothrix sp.]|jgi:C-terminal peptidase prc
MMKKHIYLILMLIVAAVVLHHLQPSRIFVSSKFDGRVLYADAYDQLMEHHILLRDPNSKFVQDWAATWQHKHDNDHVLDTEDGADTAVYEMMGSLGQRFDYYFLPVTTKDEQKLADPEVTGIGIAINQTGAEAYVKAEIAKLPKNLSVGAKMVASSHIEDDLAQLKLGPDNEAEVVKPFPGSAAEAAGVKAGDHIVAVNGISVFGKSLDSMTSEIKGRAGTSVTVTLERKDASGKYQTLPPVSIVRKAYVTPDATTQDLGKDVGYVKLNDFMSEYEVSEMRDALKKETSGKFLILDLRGNRGGITRNGIRLAQMFLRSGVILERHQRSGDDIVTRIDQVEPQFFDETTESSASPGDVSVSRSNREPLIVPDDMPIVVLVNGDTYSCAEILSGTLQFNHRAIIVGEPTGGKGVEQTVVPLVYGRSMHITSAEFMPAGMPHRTDWSGIIPDHIVAQSDDKSNVDAQLEAAKTIGWQLVAERDARTKQAEELKQKRQDDFKKSQAHN